MGLLATIFGGSTANQSPVSAEALSQLEQLTTQLTEVRGELKASREVVVLTDKLTVLQKDVARLEIEKSKKTEEFERRERELQHMVGLQQKRQEFEIDAAKREAVVTVREENLQKDRERFDGQLAFHEKRFTEEVGYLKQTIGDVLERLPRVQVGVGGPAPKEQGGQKNA